MLIPQFSIRWILGLTTVCALFALLVHGALRGQVWAGAVATGVGFLVFVMGVQAVCFALVWMFAQLVSGRDGNSSKRVSRKPVHQIPPPPASSDGEAPA